MKKPPYYGLKWFLPILAEFFEHVRYSYSIRTRTRTYPDSCLGRGAFTFGYHDHTGMWALRCPTCMSQDLNLRSSHFGVGEGSSSSYLSPCGNFGVDPVP